MTKTHCDACDAVIDGDLRPKSALIAIPGFTGTVWISTQKSTSVSTVTPELCRRCEVMLAEAFIEEMKK